MKVSFFCVHKNRPTSLVRAKLTYKGTPYTYSTGENVSPKLLKKGVVIGKNQESEHLNFQFKQIENAMKSAILHYARDFIIPSQEEFSETTTAILGGANTTSLRREKQYFLNYMDQKIKESKNAPDTIRTYKRSYNLLKKFEGNKKYTFDKVDRDYYTDFIFWCQKRGHSRNYIACGIKHLIKFMKEAHLDKLHDNIAYQAFKKEQEDSDSVYLSLDELITIHRLEFTKELLDKYYPDRIQQPWQEEKILNSLEKCRKKFLIGALCAMRFSDYNRIEKINLKNETVTIMPIKGSKLRKPKPVIMPMHWIMKEILSSGFDFTINITSQTFNSQIKLICQMAEIKDETTTYITKGGKLTSNTGEKWEFVSSHTARRSGATNMYLAGMPDELIMACTGHATKAQLYTYIKAERITTAEELRKSPYFLNK